jgi:hypothetical protein
MKLCVAPESINIQIGFPRMDNVPIIIGAPSGISTTEVKLSLPFLAWAIFFLPLLLGLETDPWFSLVSLCCLSVWQRCGHALAEFLGSPHLKQWRPLLPLGGVGTIGFGACYWVLWKWKFPWGWSWGCLATNLPGCEVCWGSGKVFYTMRSFWICALLGVELSLLFLSTWALFMASSCEMALFTSAG